MRTEFEKVDEKGVIIVSVVFEDGEGFVDGRIILIFKLSNTNQGAQVLNGLKESHWKS